MFNLISLIKKELKSKFLRLRVEYRLKSVSSNMEIHFPTYFGDNFYAVIPHNCTRKCIKIGSHCIIDGILVCETDSGNITIGDRCHIGQSKIISLNKIQIGNDVTIAWGCTFYDHNSHSVNWIDRKNDTIQEYYDITESGNLVKNKNWNCVISEPITIMDKAWIGMNVIVLKGVTIGEGAVVAAGSIVTRDVEPWTVVGGNPAVKIKKLKAL